jgi:cyclic pyranopterin monophosphate synthase
VMAAKRTADLIPLCHPVRLVDCHVELRADRRLPGVRVAARARAVDRTGVEMEAMVAVAVAALTVYDMVKGAERGVEIRGVRLDEKRGGKSGVWLRPSSSKPIAKVRSSK